MDDKQFLLTFINYEDDDHTDFAWFDTEEEMNEFIKEYDIGIIDGIQIISAITLYDE